MSATRDDLAALLATAPPRERTTSALVNALTAAGHPTTRRDLVRLLADPSLPFAVLAHRYTAAEGA